MQTINDLTIAGYVAARTSVTRFWRDQRGASVSTIMLIALLVVAVGAFAVIVQQRLTAAGTTLTNADFGDGN